jgi:ankyrin repeat protein/catechol 2,3-dioxygenase-like lactoylglutathione lyase family enzyme
MSKQELPQRASLEFLKKRAKERLAELRRTDRAAQLAAAQLAVARDYGFPSWRALKAEVDKRRAPTIAAFFAACEAGDVDTLRALLESEPSLVRERAHGTTGLHRALKHIDAVRVLLEHGADPNARDEGDNAYPLHFAGAFGVDVVRVLLDAGADVHGYGDVHELEVIGWATCFGPTIPWDVVHLLVERGAKHHVFSAIACKDLALISRVVEESPDAIARRLSRFENRQTALHYVIAPPDGLLGGGFRTGDHYAMLDLLIELGADLEATDDKGRTPLAVAMLRGDEHAMRRLRAAGATAPAVHETPVFDERIAALRKSVSRVDVMLKVADIRASIAWYQSIGFELDGVYEDDGVPNWAGLRFGGAYFMFVPWKNEGGRRDASFWINTSRVDDIYQLLKDRQLERARTLLDGKTPSFPEARFHQDIHNAFYGNREFTIIDPDGYEITIAQAADAQAS